MNSSPCILKASTFWPSYPPDPSYTIITLKYKWKKLRGAENFNFPLREVIPSLTPKEFLVSHVLTQSLIKSTFKVDILNAFI